MTVRVAILALCASAVCVGAWRPDVTQRAQSLHTPAAPSISEVGAAGRAVDRRAAAAAVGALAWTAALGGAAAAEEMEQESAGGAVGPMTKLPSGVRFVDLKARPAGDLE